MTAPRNDASGSVRDAPEASRPASVEAGGGTRAVADEAVRVGEQVAHAGADAARTAVRASLETAAQSIQRMTDHFVQVLGFHGPQSEELARRSSRNLEAVSKAGAVLAQGVQEISREWVGLAHEHLRDNVDVLGRLTRSRTVHDVIVIQTDLARDTLQRVIDTNRRVAEVSVRVADEAARIIKADGEVRRAA